jgi:hypothetical protein
MKDQLRRQIEDSYLSLRKQFTSFTAQIDGFQQAVDLEKAQTVAYSDEVKRFLATVEYTQHLHQQAMEKFEFLEVARQDQDRINERLET